MLSFDTYMFTRYMCSEFPVCDNPFARELIENVLDDALRRYGNKDDLACHLVNIIPEITESEIMPFVREN